jgi:hypothetical protein
MQLNKVSDLMQLQDDYIQKLIDGKASKSEIRDAVVLMRAQINCASFALRHGKASSRIPVHCDYIPEVYFTQEASDAAKENLADPEEKKEVMPWEESPKKETPKKETPKKETPKKEKS